MSFLTLEASRELSIRQTPQGLRGTVVLDVEVQDTRPFLPTKLVTVTVEWGDGSQVTANAVSAPYLDQLTHTYRVGTYELVVFAKNYQLPVPETKRLVFDVVVTDGRVRSPTLEEQGLQPIIYGPILPRDGGFPNVSEWKWHLSQDSVMLESAAKLLLLTPSGTRLMMPEFGTRIREFIFNQSDGTLREQVSQELKRAFSVNIPAVEVAEIDIRGISSREVSISITLISRLDQRPFQIVTSVIKT